MKAFGKVILAGEHAVVYGHMALVTRINRGVEVIVTPGIKSDHNAIVAKAIELAGGDPHLNLEIMSEIPIGSGLGSSAAVSAAVIQTVKTYLGRPITEEDLFKLAFECEKVAHGNASGLDPAAVVYGGLIAYSKGQPFERLAISKSMRLLLVNSGTPAESTKEMIAIAEQAPEREVIMQEIGSLTKLLREQLLHGGEIAALLNQNGLLLEKLGVVGVFGKQLSKELRALGCSVKITGAGGVARGAGMMLVKGGDLVKTKSLLDNRQIDYFEVMVGEQ
jgi:mevalonate kinase